MNFKTGIVLFNQSVFGGAERRYTHLFKYLSENHGNSFYYLVNQHLYNHLRLHYPDLRYDQIIIVDRKKGQQDIEQHLSSRKPKQYVKWVENPIETDLKANLPRKLYWFYKNKLRQHFLYKEIERYRNLYNIKIFLGVFSGIFPLVFYLNQQPRKAAIIFSDMDSWFSEVMEDMNKLWYRKYYTFNYALENCDFIDFLSSFIYKGVKERGVKINNEKVSVASSSFTDYSKCRVGEKKRIEVSFCSRLEPDKNPMLYLNAAKELIKKHPEVKFHILGEGSLTGEINRFLSINNLMENINFQYRFNPVEVLEKTSIFVSVQTTNNYPSQSVLEAMACGNAIIASDVGDTRLFINERNGILIPLELKKLIEALEDLISNPEKTKQLGSYAREFVTKNHTIEKSAEYYLKLFEKAYLKVFSS